MEITQTELNGYISNLDYNLTRLDCGFRVWEFYGMFVVVEYADNKFKKIELE